MLPAMRHAAAIVLLFFAFGCSDGNGNGTPAGGFVRIEHRAGESGAAATYARAEFGNIAVDLPARGRCETPGVPGAGADSAWLDVGETVTLVRAGAEPVMLPKATLGALIAYGADGLPASASPPGSRFDIALAGNAAIDARIWDGGISIPAPVVPGDFVNQIGFLVEQPLLWTPSGDADEVLVEIASAGHIDLVCRTKDSAGEVVLSDEQNAELNSAGGTVTFRALRRTHQTLDGRRVTLEGQSAVVIPYQ